jgi:hypothetical protein
MVSTAILKPKMISNKTIIKYNILKRFLKNFIISPHAFTLNLSKIYITNFNTNITSTAFNAVSKNIFGNILFAKCTLNLKKNKIRNNNKCITTVEIPVTAL